MRDYIERDVAIDAFCSLADALNSARKKQPFTEEEEITIRGKISGIYLCKGIIRTTKSADVAPVRHGHWIDEGAYADYTNVHAWRCSECEDHVLNYKCDLSRYCPNCGARMDGDFCGHPLLDKDLDGGCEWHEPIEGESL